MMASKYYRSEDIGLSEEIISSPDSRVFQWLFSFHFGFSVQKFRRFHCISCPWYDGLHSQKVEREGCFLEILEFLDFRKIKKLREIEGKFLEFHLVSWFSRKSFYKVDREILPLQWYLIHHDPTSMGHNIKVDLWPSFWLKIYFF